MLEAAVVALLLMVELMVQLPPTVVAGQHLEMEIKEVLLTLVVEEEVTDLPIHLIAHNYLEVLVLS
jgi:hypothetical protein